MPGFGRGVELNREANLLLTRDSDERRGSCRSVVVADALERGGVVLDAKDIGIETDEVCARFGRGSANDPGAVIGVRSGDAFPGGSGENCLLVDVVAADRGNAD